jgi:hypothetical protein
MNGRGHKALLALAGSATALAVLGGGTRSVPSVGVAHGAGTPPTAPVLGQSEVLRLVAGKIAVRLKGTSKFAPLIGTTTVPDGSEIDTTGGRVEVTVASTQPGQTATALVYQGRFLLHQDPLAPAKTHFTLSEPLSGCGPARLPHAKKASATIAAKHSRAGHRHAKSRHLWVSDSGGSWGTEGRYVSTTVEGTSWLTADECAKSQVKVTNGVVIVHDLIHNTTTSVAAGHEYIAVQPAAEGAGFVPPLGEVLTGETGGDPTAFQQQVGKHVAVFGFFGSWGGELGSLLSYVQGMRARLLLHLSTDVGYGSAAGQEISPAGIARGQSDDYIVRLCKELATSQAPVYLALLPEMNQTNNAYSAFNANGSSRGPSNSTAAFRQAWRRTVLILRGGAVSVINRRLHTLRMPALKTSLTALPRPKVSFMWAPQTAGTPDTPANSPAAYYPGSAYVDIVGTDFYSAYPNFSGLARLYAAYPSKPFGFNEWAMWKSGDPGFVRTLFGFVRSHRRIALMVYNEGLNSDGPFRLKRFPAATSELRRQLRSGRFLAYPPGAK